MTSEPATARPAPARDEYALPILVALLSGLAVALLLGVYGKLHHPTGFSLDVAGFSSPLYAKAWLSTAAVAFAIVQLATARRMSRPAAPAWQASVHRWSGRVAILLTVPVIIHCLYALGFQSYSLRVLVHSVLGCLFYGAFVAKMLSLSIVKRDTMPKWLIPVLGGVVFLSLIGVWLTSALWLFITKGVHT
jgi:type IV secretory pathway VirB2 component (pilin)